MPVYNFTARFADAVEDGTKVHTIRQRRRKRPTRAGDTLYLYTGQRTKHARLLRTETCTRVRPVRIDGYAVYISGDVLGSEAIERLARDDGFDSADAFFAWFHRHYGPRIDNLELIEWEPAQKGDAKP